MKDEKLKIKNQSRIKYGTKILIFAVLFFVSCGPEFISPEFYQKINSYTAYEDYDSAINLLERNKIKFTSKSAVVYHMDMAMLFHLLGKYEKSNQHIAISERIIDDLYTRRISWETASFLTNDLAIPYRGEGFEHLILNVLAALNYTLLGKYDEAAVEARKADSKMRSMGEWGEDPFVRYFMGIMFENAGFINDAYISYAMAWEIYRKHNVISNAPVSLVYDLLKTSVLMGFNERISELRNIYPEIKTPLKDHLKQSGDLLLFHMNGAIPFKIEKILEITIGNGISVIESMEISKEDQKKAQEAMTVAKTLALGTNVTVAYPEIIAPSVETIWSGISFIQQTDEEIYETSSEKIISETYLASDLKAIALAYFDTHKDKIKSRAIARAVIKLILSLAAMAAGESVGGEKWGWAVGLIAGSATMAALGASEAADTRSWRTLPAEIRLSRMNLKDGVYTIGVKYYNNLEREYREKIFENVRISPGKTTILTLRTF